MGKKLSIFLHVAAWIILFLLPVYLFSMQANFDEFFIWRVVIRSIIYIILFYLSYFWLIPTLLFQGKKVKYYLSIFGVIVGLYIFNDLANYTFFSSNIQNKEKQEPEKDRNDDRRFDFRLVKRFDMYNYLFTAILISGFSVGLRMSVKYNENEKKRKELEKEKLSSELAFLKNQVSPHFFFNTLNNIYSLTEINTKEAQNAILQLSKLMRYLLYESEKGDTKLSNEIAFMRNYIDLMKLRINDKVSLRYEFPEVYKDMSIPPLIFISFIENAFKHGLSYREKSFIHIELQVNDSEIIFNCSNSIFKNRDEIADSGIGLENIQKRLSLLYPDKHTLKIDQTEQVFSIHLTLQHTKIA